MAIEALNPIQEDPRRKAARELQIQQLASKAGGKGALSDIGTAATMEAGQGIASAYEKQASEGLTQAEQQSKQAGVMAQQEIAGLQQGLQQQKLVSNQELFDLDRKVSQQVSESFRRFNMESIDNAKLDDILRLAVLEQAGADERELDRFKQMVNIRTENKIKALKKEQSLIEAALTFASKQKLQGMEFEAQKKLMEEAQAIKEKIQRAEADAANRSAIFGSVLGIGAAAVAVGTGNALAAPVALQGGQALGSTLASTKV